MNSVIKKADTFGVVSGALCMVHCIATPFLFVVHTCAAGGCANAPVWWKSLDYFFLVVSFFAIYRSVKTTSKRFVIYALWVNWALLGIILINEKFNVVPLSGFAIYVPAMALVVLHLYNQNFCKCNTDGYCVTSH
ncbi:MAG: MerC domain-containing protein [Flavobacteriaceae bacterium]|nr:MerC domain-containing protein [Flavobacteriaceae bacterium]